MYLLFVVFRKLILRLIARLAVNKTLRIIFKNGARKGSRPTCILCIESQGRKQGLRTYEVIYDIIKVRFA